MKKLVIILALALGGCATTPTPTNISETARLIQTYTKTFCSFVPTITTIVSIINAGAGSALNVASEICAAITTAPLAEGGKRRIIVRGVVVKGKFVK